MNNYIHIKRLLGRGQKLDEYSDAEVKQIIGFYRTLCDLLDALGVEFLFAQNEVRKRLAIWLGESARRYQK